MLCIQTELRSSKISGIGLFANEFIRKGTQVWKFNPNVDQLFAIEEIQDLDETGQKEFRKYAFLDKFHGKYMLCGDDGRYFNHSENPNCDDSMKDITIAIRDIRKGEELTVDYYTFYGDIENHPEIRLMKNSMINSEP